MNGTNMDEDDYVETSDVEELASVYGQFGAPDYPPRFGMGLTGERRPTLRVRVPTPEGCVYETPRKRRKLSHPVREGDGLCVGPSQKSVEYSQVPSSQPVGCSVGTEARGVEVSGDSLEPGVEVEKRPSSPPSTRPLEMAKIDTTVANDSVMQDVKAWASWSTPRKHGGSEGPLASSQQSSRKASQGMSVPGDYEGDLLDQLGESSTPQVFSLKPATVQRTPQRSKSVDEPHEESEDELAAMPPKSTSPLATSQVEQVDSGASGSNVQMPLDFPPLSPLSPVESTHSRAEDENARTVERKETTPSSPNSVARTENAEDEALSRYPLRRRQPNQLRPYLYDEYQYKTVLKHNPAAIIDVLRLQRRRANQQEDRYQEEEEYVQEESQQQTEGQSEEVESQSQRERERERTKSPAAPLPAFIDPLSESEDESDDLAKEARRVERELRKRERAEKEKERERLREEKEQRRKEKEREREEREAKKKPRRFPMSNAPTRSERPNSHASNNRAPTSTRRPRHSRTPTPRRSQSLPVPHSSPDGQANELDALRDYFMDDFTTTVVGPDTADSEPPSSRRSLVPGLIPVIKSEADILPTRDSDDSSTESDEESQENLDRRYRELFKLYPPNMARELLEKGKNKRRSHRDEEGSPMEGPLLPGQTRIRRAANPKDIRDIRGDSESDESEAEKRSLSPQPLYNADIRNYLDYEAPVADYGWGARSDEEMQEAGPSRPRSHPHSVRNSLTPALEVIDISDEESSSSSEEEQVDDEDIRTLLGDDDAGMIYSADAGHGNVKEESMIDWMLSRTRIVGATISRPKIAKRRQYSSRKSGQPRPRTGNAHTSRSKYKIDITTRDAHKYGNERQALLSFANHTSGSKSSSGDNRPKASMATEPIEIEIHAPEPDRRKTWKERRKERSERARRQGVYSIVNPHTTGITSGRSKKPVKVTIDLNDDDFYQSFAPRSQPVGVNRNDKGKGRADPLPPPRSNRQVDHGHDFSNSVGSQPRLKKRSRYSLGECTIDMGIVSLRSGVVFSPTSFIREGHLRALLDDLIPDHVPPRPDPISLCSLNISYLMELDAFLRAVDQIFEGLLGLTTDIPADGYEEKVQDWNNLSRSTSRHITWYYIQSSGDTRNHLSSFIKNKVLSTVSGLKSKNIPSDALDIALLSLCWFCIEASVRSGHQLYDNSSQPSDPNPVHTSVKLMLHYLLAYGLRKPYKITQKNQVLEGTKMSCYVTQIWVCLLYLLPACDARQAGDSNKDNPLWGEILLHYQSLPSTNALEMSEDIWKTIFILMTFSQFSALGMAASNFQLSPSWSLVAHAIKQVQLAQNTSNLQNHGQSTWEKRDAYTAVVISRCHHLLDYWKWKMDRSFGTLNQLVDIFRARNFVNLRHEKPEYPDFMLNRDWNSLEELRPTTDSAFTKILKLFMRGVNSNCLSKAEIKKMVALIIPVSKFRTQKENIPGVDDLSPICNRFAALALAIAVDPTFATRTVNQVQNNIDFAASDPSTQLLTIRGISLLASLMIQRDVPLQEVAKWLTIVIGVAASEFKTLKLSGPPMPGVRGEQADKIRKYSLLILSLYAAGRTAMETFATKTRYPDPVFLLAFKPFLEPDCLKAIEEANWNLCEMRRFVESFLEAREKYLPLPEPVMPTTRVDDPESQDYGNFDFGIDLNDPTLLAQLEGESGFAAIKEQEKSGELLQKIIFPCFWVAKRKIQRFCEAATDPIMDQDMLRTLDSWAYCLVGCMHILIQHDTLHDWAFCFKEIVPLWQTVRVAWLKTRVQLVLCLQILRHDPAIYDSKRAELLGILFESLANRPIAIEPKFWRLVTFREGANNPLFKDAAAAIPDPFSSGESQTPLLRIFLKNIESGLQEMPESDPQVTAWIDLCLKFLSAMRSISQELRDKSEASTEYNAWCKEVLALFDDCPRLKHHQRLTIILDLISRI